LPDRRQAHLVALDEIGLRRHAVAWLVMGDGMLPEDQWADVDLGWLLTVLLSEGMDRVTAVRVVLADPGNLSPAECARYARICAHVADLFNQSYLGTSRAVGRATKQAIGRTVDRAAGLAGAGGVGSGRVGARP